MADRTAFHSAIDLCIMRKSSVAHTAALIGKGEGASPRLCVSVSLYLYMYLCVFSILLFYLFACSLNPTHFQIHCCVYIIYLAVNKKLVNSNRFYYGFVYIYIYFYFYDVGVLGFTTHFDGIDIFINENSKTTFFFF